MLSETALSSSGVVLDAQESQDASPSNIMTWQHPPSFYCPISKQVMHDPVVVSDGHTYERNYIEHWLQDHTTSPISNEELPENAVFPNHALRNAISEYFDQVFSAHRRAIRKNIRCQGEQQRFGSNEPLLHTIDALMQCSFLMNADLDTECVLRQIMNEAKSLLGAEAASVFLVDAAKQELYSKINSTGSEICIPISSGIAGRVASTGEPLLIPDAYADERFNKSNDMKTGFRTHSILCVPLTLKKGAVIGVVQLINKTGAGVFTRSQAFPVIAEDSTCLDRPTFTAQDKQFLQVFASQAASAVAGSGSLLRDPEVLPDARDSETHDTGSGDKSSIDNMLWADVESDAEADDAQTQKVVAGLAPSVPSEAEKQSAQLVPRSAAQVDSTVVSLLNDAFHGWQFDAFSLAELTDNKPLSTLGIYLFDRLGFMQQFSLDAQKVENFFVEIEKGYDEANPYHNRAHASSVMHSMYALLEHGGVANAVAAAFNGNGSFKGGHLQKLACLLAAAVHDHEHLGLTNEFLVRTRHDRATLYNDQHVNEHHHVASAFAVLHRPECNFLSELPEEDFRQLRSIVIELVLGTDMANGGNIQKSFNDTFGVNSEQPALSTQDAVLLLQMAMKCADLGHLALSRDVHERWVDSLEAEFFAQGDKETAARLPVSFLMDRNQPGCSKEQTGFFEFVAVPLLRSLVRVAPMAQPMLDATMSNYRYWNLKCNGAKTHGGDAMTTTTADFSDTISKVSSFYDGDATDELAKAKKKSGRTRQRAAKYWARVRCRTPSPEPGQRCTAECERTVLTSLFGQRC